MNISQIDTSSSLHTSPNNISSSPKKTKVSPIKESEVKKYTKKIPDKVRTWLHQRGLSDEVITQRELGYASFYGAHWITLPVRNEDNEILFFKLRRDPNDTSGNRYAYYPKASASIYGISSLCSLNERSTSLLPPKSICICE